MRIYLVTVKIDRCQSLGPASIHFTRATAAYKGHSLERKVAALIISTRTKLNWGPCSCPGKSDLTLLYEAGLGSKSRGLQLIIGKRTILSWPILKD